MATSHIESMSRSLRNNLIQYIVEMHWTIQKCFKIQITNSNHEGH